ncbi:HRDC domain-containing protein [Defluviitalea saccharophila]|uniref:HRDC domain-containing protein n=1 Tax=Defluviitalea saccharophila TaxID=879970 RepID=A0ABZ2Y4J3_9FIRM
MKCKVFKLRVVGEHLAEDEDNLNQFLEAVKVNQVQSTFIGDGQNYWSILVYYDEVTQDTVIDSVNSALNQEMPLTSLQKKLYDILIKWRDTQAEYENLPSYVVCYNQWIREMVTMPVTTLEDLAKIKGFGERRVKKYGDQILKIMEIYQKMG